MSNSKQPEHMRPIPDGGLKDAMPGWLKRPPAWRNMPSAEERHERTLPEPDTSRIDPHELLEVSDLPQWLQAIAERGHLPPPTPDAAVTHAVDQLQTAAHRHHHAETSSEAPHSEADAPLAASSEDSGDQVVTPAEDVLDEPKPTAEPATAPEPDGTRSIEASISTRSPWVVPAIAIAVVVILAIVLSVIIL